MNNVNLAFGRLLRDKRGEMKLSQAGFARKVQWPQTTVSRVEQGRRGITLQELFAAARVFGCSAADLLYELGSAMSSSQVLGGAMFCADRTRSYVEQPGFTPGFSAAFACENTMISQLARYGVKFLGPEPQSVFLTLPVEEVLLAALNFSNEPRVFEALPALVLRNMQQLDWSKLVPGAYALRLQTRLGWLSPPRCN
jgi:transcriptional regulator with XRE-family HTH domain